MYMLDSDVVIDFQRHYVPAETWFAGLTEPPVVPGFVIMELVQDARNRREAQVALTLIATFPVAWPTHADCERALEFFTKYHLSHNLGLVDSLIAACAIGLSATLCTFNLRHYRVVPGLITAQPYAR
jgi:predicted nucleic acid-binding protein